MYIYIYITVYTDIHVLCLEQKYTNAGYLLSRKLAELIGVAVFKSAEDAGMQPPAVEIHIISRGKTSENH